MNLLLEDEGLSRRLPGLEQDFEIASYTREGLIWDREMLEKGPQPTDIRSSFVAALSARYIQFTRLAAPVEASTGLLFSA